MLSIYNFIVLLLLPLIALFYLPLFLMKDKHRKNFFLRLRIPRVHGERDGREVENIWVHAVSVGEVLASIPLVKGLKRVSPGAKIFLSTITVTGHSVAQSKASSLVDGVFYLPFDLYPVISKTVTNVSPNLLIIMETEIWPNLIAAAKDAGAFVAIVNGRISDRSFPKYRRFRFFFKRVLEMVDLFLMQSSLSRERIIGIGASPDRVHVMKNLKYDIENIETEHVRNLRDAIRYVAQGRKIIVCGSTHEGEERLIIESLSEEIGRVLLVIAPRHPERFDKVAEIVSESGIRFVRRSEMDKGSTSGDADIDLVILDTLGELSGIYDIADIVIVGGSFVEIGGHNVLEPASHGIPVITGIYYSNFKDIVEEMDAESAIIIAGGPGALREKVLALLKDENMAGSIGSRGRNLVENYRGLGIRVASELVGRIK
ncbi:MAG: 3-deoxy-D-manno-octulosonic acid transferase [Deltaproteobacteria bacterium]|nr:3-deoxy-D-manno-octulosonic acid transferase [Deltaproteobacteria bacterium]NIS78190.1 3-deoxy-D-manno-octulosonic acid transferase [Deltaproteobacteria bacterium]